MEGAKPHSGHPDMKLRIEKQRLRAMTAFEVLVVVVCVLILAVLLLRSLITYETPAYRINCVSNLKQINLTFRIWEGDNNNQYPMSMSVTNGGGKELIEAGDVGGFLRVAFSNDWANGLITARILVCPADHSRTIATKWNDLNGSHISYFFSPDASKQYPRMILDGDDNLVVDGTPVKSGLIKFPPNAPIAWSGTRHRFCGNIGFVDGSVVEESTIGLEKAFLRTGLATSRIAIP
jgi:hypothetical protein